MEKVSDRQMQILSICNQKGGVGKTTTTLNLAAALQALGQRVLLIDADQQRNLTTSLLPNVVSQQTLSELLHFVVAGFPVEPDVFIRQADGLGIVASSKLLAAANSILATSSDSEGVLSAAIDAITHGGQDYDYVLIDCAPSLDLLVSNALTASSGVIIVTEPASYSVDGIVSVWETITRIQRTTNPQLRVEQIVINKFDARKKDDRIHKEEIMEAFGQRVFPAPIPLLAEVKDSDDSAKRERMATRKGSRVWPLYMALASEVISHGDA